jgi:hypothetical protein
MRARWLLGLALLLTACKAGPRVVIEDEDQPAPAARPASASKWSYKAEGTSTWACDLSVDDAAQLCFRRDHGRLDGYLELPHAGNPFFCQRGRCPTQLTVDNGAEETVQGTDDQGGGTRILFLPAPEKLLRQVEAAKRVKVKPPMFGLDQEFDFNVGGLNWK